MRCIFVYNQTFDACFFDRSSRVENQKKTKISTPPCQKFCTTYSCFLVWRHRESPADLFMADKQALQSSINLKKCLKTLFLPADFNLSLLRILDASRRFAERCEILKLHECTFSGSRGNNILKRK